MSLVVRGIRGSLVMACLAFLMAGCATTQGSYHISSPPPGEVKLSKYSNLYVDVTCSRGLLSPSDMNRIKNLIVENVPAQCSGKFKCVDQPAQGADAILAKVNITKYEEGNSLARFMLAGLGQMHIFADVTLSDYTSGDVLFQSEVKKTFAWGGMYGGTAQITDIEEGFAKAVAASFSGKE
jgi:hypothetical protein